MPCSDRRAQSYLLVKPPSTSRRATPAGLVTQRSAALRMARSARLVATGCACTKFPEIAGVFGSRRVVVSSAPSVAGAGGARRTATAPASARVVRSRRRVCTLRIGILPLLRSRLQLAFELVQEAPVGALGDNLLRGRLD